MVVSPAMNLTELPSFMAEVSDGKGPMAVIVHQFFYAPSSRCLTLSSNF